MHTVDACCLYLPLPRGVEKRGPGRVETEIIQRDDESDVVVGDRKAPASMFFFRHLFFSRIFASIGAFIFIRSLSHKSSQLAPTLVRARQERKETRAWLVSLGRGKVDDAPQLVEVSSTTDMTRAASKLFMAVTGGVLFFFFFPFLHSHLSFLHSVLFTGR